MFSQKDFCNPAIHGRHPQQKRPGRATGAGVLPDLVSQDDLDVAQMDLDPDWRELGGLRRVVCAFLRRYCPFQRLKRIADARAAADEARRAARLALRARHTA